MPHLFQSFLGQYHPWCFILMYWWVIWTKIIIWIITALSLFLLIFIAMCLKVHLMINLFIITIMNIIYLFLYFFVIIYLYKEMRNINIEIIPNSIWIDYKCSVAHLMPFPLFGVNTVSNISVSSQLSLLNQNPQGCHAVLDFGGLFWLFLVVMLRDKIPHSYIVTH